MGGRGRGRQLKARIFTNKSTSFVSDSVKQIKSKLLDILPPANPYCFPISFSFPSLISTMNKQRSKVGDPAQLILISGKFFVWWLRFNRIHGKFSLLLLLVVPSRNGQVFLLFSGAKAASEVKWGRQKKKRPSAGDSNSCELEFNSISKKPLRAC